MINVKQKSKVFLKMRTIKIYTDGSCLGNPGPGGWAALVIDGIKKIILRGNEIYTTNNRMEMKAVIEALKWMTAHKTKTAEIFSDSNLLIQSITKNWKRKKNKDLWTELDKNLKNKNIEWTWIRGHAGNSRNEEADRIAVAESIKASKKDPDAKQDNYWEPQRKLFSN